MRHSNLFFHFFKVVKFLLAELRVVLSRAIFFSIFTEVNRSCIRIYILSLGMEFFNLQVYM